MHTSVKEMRQLSETMSAKTLTCINTSSDLIACAAGAVRDLGRFRLGNSAFDLILARLTVCTRECEKMLSQLQSQGYDVFDKQYKPVANTNPQQYHTSYDVAFEKLFQPFFDRVAASIVGCDLAVMVTKGETYPPTHVSKYCLPQTGNLTYDLAHSRDKRFHNGNPMLLKCGNHTEPFQFQAYVRDIGDIFILLSNPVYCAGKHWGGFMFGLKHEALIEQE
jgi:methyl-accepting chemotaxis protein